MRETWVQPGSGRSPGERNGYPLLYSCLENSHGQRSLAGYSPWVAKSRNMPCNCSDSIFILAFSLPGLISPTPSCLPCISSALDSSRSPFMKIFLLPGRVGPFSFLFQWTMSLSFNSKFPEIMKPLFTEPSTQHCTKCGDTHNCCLKLLAFSRVWSMLKIVNKVCHSKDLIEI